MRRPGKLICNTHDPESLEIAALLVDREWDDLPDDFVRDGTAFHLMSQDAIAYYVPGIALTSVNKGEELRSLARDMLNSLCIYVSVVEWTTTLRQYSEPQRRAIRDVISYCRSVDSEFWINTSFDEAMSIVNDPCESPF